MLLVILAVAALAILASVVLVSLGKGGELTEFPPDVPPLNLPEAGELAAVDFMALQLPVNLVGYHTQSVDETLRRAAHAISARDTRIAILEQRVSELLSNRLYARQEVYAAPGAGPRTEHEPPAAPLALPLESDPHTNGHIPAASLEEPASAAHEPVTWADPADDPHIRDETTRDATPTPPDDAATPYAASEVDATPYAASQSGATWDAAVQNDATPYAAAQDDTTGDAASADATPYPAAQDDAKRGVAMEDAGSGDGDALRRGASGDGGRDHAARDDVVRDVTAGDVESGLLATHSSADTAGAAQEPVADQDSPDQARQRDGAGERVRAAGREDGDGRE